MIAELITLSKLGNIVDICVCVQERRKVYEANLQEAGLELETEDKSVCVFGCFCVCVCVCFITPIMFMLGNMA